MRRVRLSRSFAETFKKQLLYGASRYATLVVEDKRARVERTIFEVLCSNPGIGKFVPDLGLRLYRVSKTPFILLYDFDDNELRMHPLVHARSDRSGIDLAEVDW